MDYIGFAIAKVEQQVLGIEIVLPANFDAWPGNLDISKENSTIFFFKRHF